MGDRLAINTNGATTNTSVYAMETRIENIALIINVV